MSDISDRFWPKVEKSDGCWNWIACISPLGYGRFNVGGSSRLAHRISYELMVGPIPEGLVVDHKCFNRKCVNPEHLRAVTIKQNNENYEGHRQDNKSGVRGVYWHIAAKKWRAQVVHNNEKIIVGMFDKIEDASAAVLAARLSLQTHNDTDRVNAPTSAGSPSERIDTIFCDLESDALEDLMRARLHIDREIAKRIQEAA